MENRRLRQSIPGNLLMKPVILGVTERLVRDDVVRDRNEKEMLSQLERSQADLRTLGGQIANIKDADLASANNDFISAYAQIEPLEKE